MTSDRFEWNMAGLVELSNEVLDEACIPISEKIADAAREFAPVGATGNYKASIHTEVDRRTGEADWARAKVVADDPKAAILESRQGVLGRALGSVSG